jgi:hypothetical protein
MAKSDSAPLVEVWDEIETSPGGGVFFVGELAPLGRPQPGDVRGERAPDRVDSDAPMF